MKYIGAAMIVISSSMTGVLFTKRMYKRIEICNQLIDFCNAIVVAIEYHNLSPSALVEICNKSNKYNYLDFVEEENIIKNIPTKSILSEEENIKAGEFLYQLGKVDLPVQLKQIEGYKKYVQQNLDNYREIYNSKSRLYIVLGVSFGLMFSVVLI